MNKKSNWSKFALIALAIMLISITIFTLNKEQDNLANQKPEKIYVGVEGLTTIQKTEAINSLRKLTEDIKDNSDIQDDNKIINSLEDVILNMQTGGTTLDNFNRESAVNALKELLISAGESPVIIGENESLEKSNKDEIDNEVQEIDMDKSNEDDSENDENQNNEKDNVLERLEMLNKETTDIEDVLTKKTIDLMYFANEFGDNKFNRQFAASSMLIYHDIVKNSTDSKDFVPIIQSYDDLVYLDNKFMTAHIPLDIFVGTGTGIAFEMQYINGDWKLNPYTAMMSLNMMGMLNEEVKK